MSISFDFIDNNIPKYDGDKERIFAAGDSGGACLLTYTAAMIKCRPLAMAAKVKAASIDIKALGLISGMFYTTKFDKIGMFLPRYLYGKNYKKSAFGKYVNPDNKELIESLAPVWLVTSHNDYLRKYTLNFDKALAEAGKEYEFVDFPKDKRLTHAFSVFEPFLPESKKTIDLLAGYLKKF